MTLKDDLESRTIEIFRSRWSKRNGTVVPSDTSLTMGNDGIELDATVLYADLSESTKMVDSRSADFAAEVYKSFLFCAARVIQNMGGVITAYDGDRVMAVFMGASKNTSAVKTGLKINWACKNIVQPLKDKFHPANDYRLFHTVGIDTSKILVAKTGVRGSNDLVWVGRAANWAAKLCTLDHAYSTRITAAVYDNMNDEAKISKSGVNMWERMAWTHMNNATIYRSNWRWEL
ncbi:adenylate/guanylate cyclase domain-containing protein [bacterium M00.F.Ca.ET.194.01.1.1]|nr:adenylate/guanylate cyclase domain-containing protein [bacterium M00.F.Ca.ET.194.01.1.1]TGS56261.1 adenylate/guanylate cyclase domain-containing protein [bacterium M00.F.Ca.ET.179.01.1.1]TGV49166.1 adenylate/guanylate cyclase domain-containing protein [bacterium M00.F.Ca.ET.168.01.1.1]